MSQKLATLLIVSAAIAWSATGIARADCESDLGLLEKALAAPGLKPDAKAALEAAGVLGASALRKDDDAGCNKAVMDGLASAGVAAAPAPAAVATTVPLGDLKPFRVIAGDTLTIVKSGDLAAAKARIKDLETAWDKSAKTLKAGNLDKWNVIDKAVDSVLKKLRAPSPTIESSALALQALIGIIDKTT